MPQTPPSPVTQLLHGVHRHLAQVLFAIPSQKRPLLLPEEFKHHGVQAAMTSQTGEALVADFAFIDEGLGFVGYFKAYDEADWGPAVLQDLHRVSLLVQEQTLRNARSYALGPASAEPAEAGWTHYLFAVVPGAESDRVLEQIWPDIGAARLTEAVGLNLLPCTPELAETLGASQPKSKPGKESRERLHRFLAPLLLNLRGWTSPGALHADRITRYFTRHLERLSRPLDAGPNQLSDWMAAQMRPTTLLAQTSPPAVRARFSALENVTLRRFTKPTGRLPFGRVTVVYGLNGSGKSSLLEAIELGLTGRLRRLDAVLDQVEKKRGSKPDLYARALDPDGGPVTGSLCLWAEQPTEHRLPLSVAATLASPQPSLPIDTFFLRQEQLREFVLMNPEERYSWMAACLGIPTRQMAEALESLAQRVIEQLKGPYERVTGKMLSLSSRNVRESMTNEMVRTFAGNRVARLTPLEQVRPALEFLVVVAGTKAPEWLKAGQYAFARLTLERRRLEDALAIFQTSIAQFSPAGEQSLEVARDGLTTSLQASHGVFPTLEHFRDRLKELLDPVQSAATFAERRLSRPESAYDGGPGTARERLAQLQQQLGKALEARQGLNWALEQTSAAAQFTAQARMLAGSLGTVPDLSQLEWPDRPADWPAESELLKNQLLQLHHESVELTYRWEDRFDKQARRLQDQIRLLHKLIAELEAEAAHLRKQVGPQQSDLHEDGWPNARWRLAQFAARLGILDPAEPHDKLDDPGILRRVVDAVRHCDTLIDGVSYFLAQPLDEKWWVALSVSDHWHSLHTDLKQCGPLPLLFLFDRIQEQRDALAAAAHKTVAYLIDHDVMDLWRELIWTLTAHAVGQPEPTVRVSEKRAYVEAVRAPATAVFNAAEQNIMGLAWFLTSYLLVGRKVSDTVILDDPIQNMDDANLSNFVRIFDDLLGAIDAKQLVLAIHQPAVRDYLQEEFAVDHTWHPGLGPFDPEQAFVTWNVEATGATSKVSAEVRPLRRPMAWDWITLR